MSGGPERARPIEEISGYRFQPGDLGVGTRIPGISAFMRIRNGEDFLEATIRSHIGHFDEIVAVYNQCTDATPDILARLAQEFGPKLKVFHYLDRVYPPGSADHAREPANSPNSLVNYYNFALCRTTRTIATKLDDDHLAIAEHLEGLCQSVRSDPNPGQIMHCFSGLNLMRDGKGRLAIAAGDMISGNGDIGFFHVTPSTFFAHDRRFERFRRGGAKRVFGGFVYWHLKYLKDSLGFGNYELEANPNGRYGRKRRALEAMEAIELDEAKSRSRPGIGDRLAALASDKRRFLIARNVRLGAAYPHDLVAAALDDTAPDWRGWLMQ